MGESFQDYSELRILRLTVFRIIPEFRVLRLTSSQPQNMESQPQNLELSRF